MRDFLATLVAVEHHPLPYFSLTLAVPSQFDLPAPGQFVMLQTPNSLEPYLRRPFSIFDIHEERSGCQVELLGKVVGRGTRALAGGRAGERLPLLGPLGRGFRLAEPGPVAVVAGGVGVAGVHLLCHRLAAASIPFDLFYGARSSVDLTRREDFVRFADAASRSVILVSEDGSVGETGLVTTALERRLRSRRYTFLYACGPMPLLRRLAMLCSEHGMAGEAALETPMGCGFGACLGCAVPHHDGRYALCCTDGPVFRFEEVAW
jgi:dihydroorotate dehydrogenase electron transfer subunit